MNTTSSLFRLTLKSEPQKPSTTEVELNLVDIGIDAYLDPYRVLPEMHE